jgi:hypothetical protein
VSDTWIYVAVAGLHVPGMAVIALLLRDLARSDPPDVPDSPVRTGAGPEPPGWRWHRRPRPGPGPRTARSGATRRSPAA